LVFHTGLQLKELVMPHSMHSQAADAPAAEFLDAFDISSSPGDTSIYFGSFIIGNAAVPEENLAEVPPMRKLRRIVTFGHGMKAHLIAELMATQSVRQRQDALSYVAIILAQRGLPALVLPTSEQIQEVSNNLINRTPTPSNRPGSAVETPASVLLSSTNASALTTATNALAAAAPVVGTAIPLAPAADAPAAAPAPADAPAGARSTAERLRELAAARGGTPAPAARVPHQVGTSR
jgi:hypothetical protein